jgi:hypothetical protein
MQARWMCSLQMPFQPHRTFFAMQLYNRWASPDYGLESNAPRGVQLPVIVSCVPLQLLTFPRKRRVPVFARSACQRGTSHRIVASN